MQLLCQPFHRGALPCNYNRGSLNHLWAQWGNSRAAVPSSPRGQWPEAASTEQTEPCLSGSSVLEHCCSLSPRAGPWRRCLPVPGLSALLYKDGIDLCRPNPRLVQSHRAPWLWQSWTLPCPWGDAGLSSQLCASVCLSPACRANDSGLGEAQHLVGGRGCKAASGNISCLLRCL